MGVGEGGFNAADGAAVGVTVGDERGVVGESGVAAEDVDFGADTAKLCDRVLDEGLTAQRQEAFIRAHARAAAAGKYIAGDERGWHH
jgi:hypothetical protein